MVTVRVRLLHRCEYTGCQLRLNHAKLDVCIRLHKVAASVPDFPTSFGPGPGGRSPSQNDQR